MDFYTFGKKSGHSISTFNSDFIMSRILQTEKETRIGCMYLEENGVIGYHQATTPQLLLIVSGEGCVRGEEDKYYSVQPGDAVFWKKDEWHETKTEKGLTALVVESKELNPSLFMDKR